MLDNFIWLFRLPFECLVEEVVEQSITSRIFVRARVLYDEARDEVYQLLEPPTAHFDPDHKRHVCQAYLFERCPDSWRGWDSTFCEPPLLFGDNEVECQTLKSIREILEESNHDR
jgi:hypothetical protein